MKDYSKEIERYIDYAIKGIRSEQSLSHAIDKLCWCLKFKKISRSEFDRLSDKIIYVQENKYI